MFWYRTKVFLLALGVIAGYGSAFCHAHHHGFPPDWHGDFGHECAGPWDHGPGPAPDKAPTMKP